ncbi:MAG: DUF6183 family protein [Nitriliruptoraceae bacterium]
MTIDLAPLLARGDLDELVLLADDLATQQRWSELLGLRDGCRRATEDFGKQLWGVAQYAEYRVALDGPDDLAAGVVEPGAGRFALGPLTEVIAQNHPFHAIADGLHPSVIDVVAQERVIRGEDLTADDRHDPLRSGLPAVCQPWEPAYPRPTYRRTDRLDGDPPAPPAARPAFVRATPATGRGERTDVERALGALVEAWVRESGGVVTVASTAGGPNEVLGLLDVDEAQLTELTLSEATVRMAGAGASGGARGRRRGGAAGRAGAWWVIAAACGLDLPCEPDELEYRAEDRRWYEFGRLEAPQAAWSLYLIITDPGGGWSAAIEAYDTAPVDDAAGAPSEE